MRRTAEGVGAVADRKGISVRPKDLVAVTCAKISVIGTIEFKRAGEPFRGDQGSPKYRGLRILHGSADGASLGASGDGGGPGIEPSWR
eukprot:1158746-Pelagomonas_calceolata.AAC.7